MTMEPAIRVEGLGKRYRVRQPGSGGGYGTLRDAVSQAVLAPIRAYRSASAATRKREEFWSLRDVSFEIRLGEVVGIIGRNGAGKSTLLKILSRITRPTTGRVEINGRVGSLLEVGTGFHRELTGRENVYLNGSILGMTRREIAAKFDEIVAFSEVGAFLDTPVKRYSSGMYVRLAFAVAAYLEPEILIVDEVLAVGDAGFQKKCMEKMRSFADSGRTVLFVSHNMNAAAKLCETGILLEHGQVTARGPVNEVIREYSHVPDTNAGSLSLALDRNSTGRRVGLIRGIEVRNESGEECYAFAPDAVLEISLALAATPSVSGALVGLGVNNPLGERTFACASYVSGVELGTLRGNQTVQVRMKLPTLVPGTYTLDVVVMEADGEVLQSVYPFAAIEITDSENRLRTASHMPEHLGHVIVPAKWEVAGG